MNSHLRDRILRKLENLSDERAYQVLDYVEFVESKYAERQSPTPNVFQRFAETVEDHLRAGRVSAATISEAMGLMNRAVSVLNGVAAAGKSVASDIVSAARPAGSPQAGSPPAGAPPASQPPGAQPAAPPSAPQPGPHPGSQAVQPGGTPPVPPQAPPPPQPSGEHTT